VNHAKHSRSTEKNRLDKEAIQIEQLQTTVHSTETNQLNQQIIPIGHLHSTEVHQVNRQSDQISTGSNFHLTNQQILIQDAFNFLNSHDPDNCKWSDFEKNPIKSLLLWYANAGCFAFDEYKEYSMSSDGNKLIQKH